MPGIERPNFPFPIINRASEQNSFQENTHEKTSCLLGNFVRASGPEWPSHKTRILSTTATPERRGIRLLKDEDIRKLYTPGTKPKTFPLDERKSIFVTDQAILDLFTFDELIERLASHRAPHKISKEQLFRQWWDTANPKTEFNLSFGVETAPSVANSTISPILALATKVKQPFSFRLGLQPMLLTPPSH